MTDPLLGLPPGRLLYNRARKLRKAKLAYLLNRVTVVPREDAKVIPFPTKEVADGSNQGDQA
jgi:hypothetical protein